MNERTPNIPTHILAVPDGVTRPLWSVMIPVYNCIDYLAETLECVLKQDLGPEKMQIDVIDDHSTDGDVEQLVYSIGKGRVGYYRQVTNLGSLRNFETCLNRSKGFLIHLLHGDDKVKLGFYHAIESLFNENPEAGAAFTNHSYIDSYGRVLPIVSERISDRPGLITNFINLIAKRQLLQPPAIVVRRNVYEQIGGFYAVHYGEDWEMWSRIASRYSVAHSPEILAFYRVANKASVSHKSFLTGQNITDIIKVVDIIQNYLPEHLKKINKKYAFEYYSVYCIKVANTLLSQNKKAAFIQVKGALKMSKSPKTLFWFFRFWVMYLTRFKDIQGLYKVKTD